MNILVIGGTGYMGKMMVERLLDRGDRVTVFSRGATRPSWWDRIAHIPGDRNDRSGFVDKLRGLTFDAVVDTQAYRREDVEAAVRAFTGGVGRYLLVSTGSVYLEGHVDISRHCPYDETAVNWDSLEYDYPPNEDPYAVGKRHCEKWLLENAGTLPFTIIRIPAVMGPEDPTGRMWWWVQRALDGGPVVVPSELQGAFRTFYSADAAANFVRVLDAPHTIGQTYFIGMPEIMNVERWTNLIWSAAGNARRICCVPRPVIDRQPDLAGYLPPLTRPVSNLHDLSKAQRDIVITATPVEEWVPATVNWYRSHNPGHDSDGYQFRQQEINLAVQWEDRFGSFIANF